MQIGKRCFMLREKDILYCLNNGYRPLPAPILKGHNYTNENVGTHYIVRCHYDPV